MLSERRFIKNLEVVLLANYVVSISMMAVNAIFWLGLEKYINLVTIGTIGLLLLLYVLTLPLFINLLFILPALKPLSWIAEYNINLELHKGLDIGFNFFTYALLALFAYRIKTGRSRLSLAPELYYIWLLIVLIAVQTAGDSIQSIEYLTKWLNYFIVGLSVNIKFNEEMRNYISPVEHKFINIYALFSLTEIALMIGNEFTAHF